MPFFQLHLPRGEFSQAHLGSLRIKDEGNDPARLFRRRPHLLDASLMLRMRSVGKIESGTVHPIFQESRQNPRPLRCWAHGTDNFRFLQHTRPPSSKQCYFSAAKMR